jgi:hypothetical protein
MSVKRRFWTYLSAVGIGALSSVAYAEEATAPAVKFGGFIDTYYAYDFRKPGPERVFLNPAGASPAIYATQPARHNEFNINLAFLEAKVEAARVRGRLALQMGTSVQANYAGESAGEQARAGGSGAGGLSRHIQEAVAGYEIAPGFWVDAGIYLSHIGLESFISRDNITYTRSLGADNSPYYQSGARFSYAFSEAWSAQLHLLNGWQNINENNSQKAVGTQVAFSPSSSLSITHNSLVGYEGGSRIFQDLVVKYAFNPKFQLAGFFDYGLQRSSGSRRYRDWYAAALVARFATGETVAVNGRVERFFDPDSSVLSAGPAGLRAWGASVGVDVALRPNLTWRSEVRALSAAASLFPSQGGVGRSDSFAVTSLALTI